MKIEDIIEFIKIAHDGQVDKCGKEYWTHPYRVYLKLPKDLPEYVYHAALCHDIVEDTCYDYDYLKELGLEDEAIVIVNLLTKREGDNYSSYIYRICDSGNEYAMIVKLADLFDNTDPTRRFGNGFDSLCKRYKLNILLVASHLSDKFKTWVEENS